MKVHVRDEEGDLTDPEDEDADSIAGPSEQSSRAVLCFFPAKLFPAKLHPLCVKAETHTQ